VRDSHARILLIEDDPSICELMESVFQDEGYAVTVCASPSQAMTFLDRGTFDLVVTDGFSKVPEAVATSTADVLRGAGTTPVVLSTAHGIDVASAQAAGFRDLIAKPFDLSTLLQQIQALLGR
jgi:DNA-binding response OmpR family regulator